MSRTSIPRWLLAAALACASNAASSHASNAPGPPPAPALAADSTAIPAARDSVVPLPVFEVREVRTTDDPALRGTPGFARAYDVTRAHGRLCTVAELLSGGLGVHVRQFGGLGSFSAVSIRGSASSQVAVYLDGVPLNQAQYGVVNASDLPIEALGRIEVYRGPAPLSFTSPGGGVVQLVPRQVEGTFARVRTGVGDFGTRKSDGSVGFARAHTSALLVGQWLSSDGNFPYLDDNATDSNPDDDVWTTRANNAFHSLAFTGRIAQGLGPVDLALTHDRLDKDQGSPGTGANTALFSSFATDRTVTSLAARATRLPASPGIVVYGVRHRDRFADPARELTGSRQDNDDRTTRDGARIDLTGPMPDGHVLSGAFEARRERYTPKQNLPTPKVFPTSERELLILGFEDRITLPGGRAGLTAQVRQESVFDDFPAGPAYAGALPSPAVHRTTRQTCWTVGARGDLLRSTHESLELRASVSRLARVPTLEELFGNRGGVHGNPNARPEDVFTRDIGLVGVWERTTGPAVLPRRLEGQTALWRSNATDLLVFIQNSSFSSVAQNISAAQMSGAEIGVRAAWVSGFSADLQYTRQWTKDEGEVRAWYGNQLPGRPEHETAARFALARGPCLPFVELHHVGGHPLDRANLSTVPARTLVDFGANFAVARGVVDLGIECRNLTDQDVQDFGGYPLPGRAFYASIGLFLDRKDMKP